MVDLHPLGRLRACDMILMDSSLLIYLAKAGCLDLLLKFSARIFVPDEVYFEAAGRWFENDRAASEPPPPADARLIFDFISGNPDRFQIVATQLGGMLAQQRRSGQHHVLDNAGEMAAVSVYERRRELTGDRNPVLVVFEDTEVPLRFAQKDTHLLSAYGLLVAMELAGHLPSAQQAFDRIPATERPSNVPFDRSVRGDSEYRTLIERN